MLFLESIDDLGLDVQVGSANFRRFVPLASAEDCLDLKTSDGSNTWSNLLTGPTFIADGNMDAAGNTWTASSGVTVSKLAVPNYGVRSPLKALQFVRSDTATGNRYMSLAYSGLSTTSRYYFEAWIMAFGSMTDAVEASINNQFITNSIVPTVGTWQRIRRYFVPTATSGTIYIRQETAAIAGIIWYVDDVFMCKVSTSTGFWPQFKSKADALTYADVSIPSASLSLTDNRDVLGAATLDNVDVQMGGEMTLIPAVLLGGSVDAEMAMEGTLTVTETDWLDGSVDVDVNLQLEFIVIRFFWISDALDMDLSIDGPTRMAFIYYMRENVFANLYKIFVSSDNYIRINILTFPESPVRINTSLTMRRIKKAYLPPAPEPAVGGDPPPAGGVIVRALWGVVVDMDAPTITDGIPK